MTALPPARTTSIRSLVAAPELAVLPGVYDGLSASLAERSGFPGLYLSGAAVSISLIGYPDLGFVTQTEMTATAARVGTVTSLPLLADADTGFGNPLAVQRTVREYEQAGVSGIQLEDQDFPKRCGHLAGKSVIRTEEFVEKIHAAVEARRNPETMIIARTDARRVLGLDEAVARANAYAEAGADLLFIEAPETEDEIKRIPGELGAPVMFNVVQGGFTPEVSFEQITEWGYALAILPGSLITPVVKTLARALAKNGAPRPIEDEISGPEGLFGAVGLQGWLAAADKYAVD